jgi:hypothetical protein
MESSDLGGIHNPKQKRNGKLIQNKKEMESFQNKKEMD